MYAYRYVGIKLISVRIAYNIKNSNTVTLDTELTRRPTAWQILMEHSQHQIVCVDTTILCVDCFTLAKLSLYVRYKIVWRTHFEPQRAQGWFSVRHPLETVERLPRGAVRDTPLQSALLHPHDRCLGHFAPTGNGIDTR